MSDYLPSVKITVFGAVFEVNRSIGRLWDLLGHFNEKDMSDCNKYYFLLNNSTI